MSFPEHILIIRLSAAGDVAMTVPVIHSLQKKYPDIRLTILTDQRLAPLFQGLKATLFFAKTKTEHKGMPGLVRLFRQLRAQNKEHPVDAVADLHHVLRSQVIRKLYQLTGVQTEAIDKGRNQKKALTRKEHKVFRQLPSSFDRYREVFSKLGLEFEGHFHSVFSSAPELSAKIISVVGQPEGQWIGIAPYAAYAEKMYPLEKMEQVIASLSLLPHIKLILFGSPAEALVMQEWETKYQSVVSIAGRLSLSEELVLMAHLELMVSMDSANMHFASLVNTKVISVWGATHPFAGFMGWQQSIENAVQVALYCRPCSVFGNKPCYRGDHACMNTITPDMITEKVNHLLQKSN